jgi:pyruvate/2-oxoglutarate/acetoin dehydrogenase E1 component
MREEMHRDENVFLMGEDIGLYADVSACHAACWKEFGEKRIVETPISETGSPERAWSRIHGACVRSLKSCSRFCFPYG